MKKIIEFVFVSFIIIMIPILSMNNMGIPCMFNKITGLYCPGCGITRAVIALMKLDIKTALDYNFCFVIFAPFMILFGCYEYYKEKKDVNYDTNKFNKVWYFFVIVFLSFGILRNIPIFSYFAP